MNKTNLNNIQSLNGTWILKGDFLEKPVEGLVPGSVYSDLLNKALIPDPFDQDNEYFVRDIMKHDFSYERTFMNDNPETHKFLICEGLDTLANIYINNTLLAKTDNMHRTYRFDLDGCLVKGENTIKIVLESPLNYIAKKRADSKYELFQASDAVLGYVHLRKGSSMFGWDWGPQLPDAGIFRDIYIENVEKAVIDDVLLTQTHQTDRVLVTIKPFVTSYVNHNDLSIQVTVTDPLQQLVIDKTFAFQASPIEVEILNPYLWNPLGYGNPYLYQVKITLIENKKTIDFLDKKIGLREVKLIQNQDQYGETFTFNINGVDVFAKGANYIPEDNLLARTNKTLTRDLLESARESNHNMVRVWGGGIYPPNYFYDLCDELGLLVWQDLMFACSAYDMEDQGFIDTMVEEIKDNLRRIRNHPSIVLICGNNENETAIENWNVENQAIAKTFYIKQYTEIIPQIVSQEFPNMPYWRSSPSSVELFKNSNSDNYGDMHYWGVWHANEPITYYRKLFPRFMSEFGLQSFPTLKTVETFAKPADLNIFSYVMEQHQKNKTSNSKILNYVGKMFQYPKDFESLLYVSQLIQAEGIRYGVEHWRRNYGRCMGILYWQLNDCWPVASWSSIDYFHRWKALHYHSKKFYEPIMVSIEENQYQAKVFLTNDTLESISGTLSWELLDLAGNVIANASKDIELNPQSSKSYFDLDFSLDKKSAMNKILYVSFAKNNTIITTNQVAFVPDKHLLLEKPNISVTLQQNQDLYTLTLKTDTVARYVEVTIKDLDTRFSDNYFHLIPGKEKQISFHAKTKIKPKDIRIKTLKDSY